MPVCLPEEGRAVPLPAQGSRVLPLAGAWAFPPNTQSPEATGMRPDRVLTYVGINRAENSPGAASQQLSQAFRGRLGSSKTHWVFLQLPVEAAFTGPLLLDLGMALFDNSLPLQPTVSILEG